MEKSPEAFRTISEVADFLQTPAHVLRFWESRFPQIRPVKRAGGRRYYRPSDVDLLTGIKKLLHEDGLTIRGVQKILREQGVRHVAGLTDAAADVDDPADAAGLPEAAAAPEPEMPPVADAPEPKPKPTKPAAEADENQSNLFANLESSSDTDDESPEDPAEDGSAPEETPEPMRPALASVGGARVGALASPDDQGSAATSGIEKALEQSSKPSAPARNLDDLPPMPRTMPRQKEEATSPTPPDDAEGTWIASGLRHMRTGSLGHKRQEVEAVISRLVALRDRMADLGRVPRR